MPVFLHYHRDEGSVRRHFDPDPGDTRGGQPSRRRGLRQYDTPFESESSIVTLKFGDASE